MLSLFARLYAVLMRLRNAAYDRGVLRMRYVSVPVLSVGNITAGGTGKTPVVEYLLAYCLEQGLRPAVVTRGYRRKSRGLVVVSDGRGSRLLAEKSGDEAAQIARKFPGVVVIADADRVRGARHAVSTYGADVILLDDAFQHRAIARDCDIVVVDAQQDLAAQRMIPAGRLREPLDYLRRADMVLLSRCRSIDACAEAVDSLRRWTDAPVFSSTFHAPSLKRLSPAHNEAEAPRLSPAIDGTETVPELSPDTFAGHSVIAFCGIGSPNSFRRLLTDLHMQIDTFHSVGDHHWYSQREMRGLVREALQRTGGILLTTEKDAVRLADEDWVEELLGELSFANGEVGVRETVADKQKVLPGGIYYPVLRLRVLEREDGFLSEIRRHLPGQ